MIKLSDGGAYLINGIDIVEDSASAVNEVAAKTGCSVTKEEAAKNTIAYGILEGHNTSGNMEKLKIKFDKMTSHDITFVGIIQTARDFRDLKIVKSISKRDECTSDRIISAKSKS